MGSGSSCEQKGIEAVTDRVVDLVADVILIGTLLSGVALIAICALMVRWNRRK